MNAEVTAGGIPHWVTSQVVGILRTNDTDYRATWQEYMAAVINTTVPNQITNGGPVIGMSGMSFFSDLVIDSECY